ncbi:MAG: class I SAM-dependent methyltransferase [Rickettsiales bacterium]
MDITSPIGLYGTPAASRMEVAGDAVQLSPLVVGSRALDELPAESFQAITVLAPPGTLERRYVLAHALRILSPGATLTAFAAKDKGGKRLATELQQFGCDVQEASRQHDRICTTQRPAMLRNIDDAIMEGGPQRHAAHGLWTQPGVFSWDRIDEGSALLLQHLPPLHGHGADLGCGLGVLANAVLHAPQVQRITLVDLDARAITMAKRNVHDLRAEFLWADACGDLPLTALDFVVMNPPFHASGVEDKSLGQQFIIRASALLKQGGQCWLTANRHLPYEALLAQHFAQHARVAEANGFKIYRAEK